MAPTLNATLTPTVRKTSAPTVRQTIAPTAAKTKTSAPTPAPNTTTNAPTVRETTAPTVRKTSAPTIQQTIAPTAAKTKTSAPTTAPNKTTNAPTVRNTTAPTVRQTSAPTIGKQTTTTAPTMAPVAKPTSAPVVATTTSPTTAVTIPPTLIPVTTPPETGTPTTSNTIPPTLSDDSASPSSATATASPTAAVPTRTVTISPFQLVLVGADELSSDDDDYDKLQDLILQYLSRFMEQQFSFNLDFDFTGPVTGSITKASGNVVTLNLEALFADSSRLVPTPDGVDILARTAFGNPFVNEFLLLLTASGPPLSATTNVIYSNPP
jgi:hypothetical protein